MKKHGLTKILAVMLLIVIIATYFIEGRQGISHLAFGDVIMNYFQSFYYFFDTAIFILVVGAFYGLLENVPAYTKLQENIVAKIKNKKTAIFAIITIFALLSSLTGLNFALLIFIPFAISIVLTMGYDKIVALFSTVGAVSIGFIGGIMTTFRDSSDYYGQTFTNFDKMVGLDSVWTNLLSKILLLIISTALLIFFVNRYIEKNAKNKVEKKTVKEEKKELVSKIEKTEVKKETKKEDKKEIKKTTTNSKTKKSTKQGAKTTKKKNLSAAKQEDTIVIKKDKITKTWPLIIIFITLLLVLVLGYLPWNSLFNITIFNDFHTWLTEFTFDDLHKFILVILCIILVITIINFKNKVIKEKKIIKIVLNVLLMIIELCLIILFAIYAFNINIFGIANILKKSTLWDSSVYSSIISQNITAFGTWSTLGNYLMAMIMLVVFSFIIKYIYKIKFNDMIDYCAEGAKKMLPSTLVAMLAYTVLVCTYNNGFMETIITNATDIFEDNIMIHSLISILGSVTNVDLYYTVIGIFTPIVNLLPTDANLEMFAIAFQGFYGLVQLIGPTSLLLVVCLTYTEVSYKEWLKNIWRVVLGLFIIIFVVMLIVSLI